MSKGKHTQPGIHFRLAIPHQLKGHCNIQSSFPNVEDCGFKQKTNLVLVFRRRTVGNSFQFNLDSLILLPDVLPSYIFYYLCVSILLQILLNTSSNGYTSENQLCFQVPSSESETKVGAHENEREIIISVPLEDQLLVPLACNLISYNIYTVHGK